MPRIALTIEYNGAAFHGWQRQPRLRTIHEELKATASCVLREAVAHIYASGRTDSGVSARAQVVAFDVSNEPDLSRLKSAINSMMRGDLAVNNAVLVPNNFHPRGDAIGKEYRYRVLNRPAPPVLEAGRVWHVSWPLSLPLMRRLITPLIGTHDFASFRNSGCDAPSTIKTISEISIVAEPAGVIEFRIVGSGFLKQMVRIIVGTVIDLARGRTIRGVALLSEAARTDASMGSNVQWDEQDSHSELTPEAVMRSILDRRDRTKAGVTAPPQGLSLERVIYPPDITALLASQ